MQVESCFACKHIFIYSQMKIVVTSAWQQDARSGMKPGVSDSCLVVLATYLGADLKKKLYKNSENRKFKTEQHKMTLNQEIKSFGF